MSTRVVLFANLREDLGVDGVEVNLAEPCKLPVLIELLASQHGAAWRDALTAENIKVAVNQELTGADCLICDNDEVAFFPPVTGG